MTVSGAGDVGRLLEHAEWVRVLATRLVRDDADDAVQELWLSALRSPPDPSRPARPWLARVLVNAARKRFRDESTRASHEASAPAPHEEGGPEALIGQVEVQQRLVQQVIELDEPLRQTVLLRFFEGLTSAEIADQMKVPAGTVRWRLKQALDRLRVALDADQGGESWRLAIAPLVLPSAGPWLITGAALMDKKFRLAVVAVCLLLVGVLGWSLPRALGRDDANAPLLVEVAQPGGTTSAPAPRPAAVAPSTPTAAVVSSAAPPAVPSASPPAPPRPAEPDVGRAAAAPRGVAGAAPNDAGARFGIDPDGIRSAVRSMLPEVQHCYEAWLAVHPGLGGRLVTSFTIDTDDGVEGRVTRISLADAGIGHVPLEGCILSSVSDLRFEPPLDGPLNVTYPMVLTETDGGTP
jgi:RNA polymerase sigma factor (sigma-70 family)